MKKYFSFIKPLWFLFSLGVLFNLLFGLFKTQGAVYIKEISDAIEGGQTSVLPALVLIGGGLTFLSFLIRWLGAIVPQYLSERFSYETKLSLFQHLSKMPFLQYEGYNAGDLQSRFQNDGAKAGFALYIVLSRMLSNVFLFIFSIWAMAVTDLWATVAAVAIVVVATVINQRILKNMKKREKEVQVHLGEMTKALESTVFALETLKTAGGEAYGESLYKKSQAALCRSKMKVTVIGAVRTLWYGLIENLCLYGSIAFLGAMGIQGKLSIGEVLMFIYLVKQIIMPIEMILRWMASLPGCSASLERIEEILDGEEATSPPPKENLAGAREVGIRNIRFAYGEEKPIIAGMSLLLQKNQLTLISGDSGSGKTTLLKILS
ncbi:MAG: ABC transporter ATP-binding protein, partial [Oscillospiraceae bacterium]